MLEDLFVRVETLLKEKPRPTESQLPKPFEGTRGRQWIFPPSEKKTPAQRGIIVSKGKEGIVSKLFMKEKNPFLMAMMKGKGEEIVKSGDGTYVIRPATKS